MSDMVDNGSSGGARPLLPGESHDEFLELSALAMTGLLTAEERRRLAEHLRICPACRDVHREYQALVDAGTPSAVAGDSPEASAARDSSLDAAEVALFARLDRESPEQETAPSGMGAMEDSDALWAELHGIPSDDESDERLWHGLWWQVAAAVVLMLALGFSVYHTGIRKGAEMAALPAAGARPAIASGTHEQGSPQPGEAKLSSALHSPSVMEDQSRVADLRAELQARDSEVARLRDEKAALQHHLDDSQAEQSELRQSQAGLSSQLTATQANLAQAEQRLEAIAARNSQSTVEVAALEHQIANLNDALDSRDQQIARQQGVLDHDRDIRELIGSRNLYIAEVYDVDKEGNTRRPFGRVFYTKGKSLVFYAYDLDQQPHLRDGSTFQAWGRRGPDQDRAVSLGVLYADNAQKKRWVLKADNPKTLADIDAVFVTAEPAGGSSHPSGKPLLFAYLRVEPNHP